MLFTFIITANIAVFIILTIKVFIEMYHYKDDGLYMIIVMIVAFIGLTSVLMSTAVCIPYVIEEIKEQYEEDTNDDNINDVSNDWVQ